MEQLTDDLLVVQVAPNRLAEIKAIFTSTKWIVGLGFFYSLVTFTSGLVRVSYLQTERFGAQLSLYIDLKALPWMMQRKL